MATRIYSPHNEFGKALVPIGTTREQANVQDNSTIDISWLNTINEYTPGGQEGNDSKLVLYPALESGVQHAIKSAMTQFKFTVLSDESDLPQSFSAENINELKTTIYLVAIDNGAGDKNKYVEYVCKNTNEYQAEGEQEKTPEYEQLGSINYVLPKATNEVLGGVQLSDEADETKTAVAGGWAATPKAIADLQKQIQSKATSFNINNNEVTQGTEVTIAGDDSSSGAISVETSADDGVSVTIFAKEASDTQKGVTKLYTKAESSAELTDGALTAKATVDEIKKVETKVDAIKVPEVKTEELDITDGKVTIQGTNIVIVSTSVESDTFFPQVTQTGSACELTFCTSDQADVYTGKKATVNYIVKPAES